MSNRLGTPLIYFYTGSGPVHRLAIVISWLLPQCLWWWIIPCCFKKLKLFSLSN